MSEAELDLYCAEFSELMHSFINAVNKNKGYIEPDTWAPVETLYREQLRAAYTNGYEDHAAMCNAVSH